MEPLIFEERWKYITEKSVPNILPNKYSISDTGKVYSESLKRLLIPQMDNEYYRVGLYLKDGTRKRCTIHRLVAIEFIPNPDYKNLQVNHFDGNKANNCVWNLEWVTGQQNIQHAFKRNLVPNRSGENSNSVTITHFQAEMIAYLLSFRKYTHSQIADIVNCSINIVDQISKGETWKDVYEQYELYKYKNIKPDIVFSDNELHMILKYFEDHKNIKYTSLLELFKETLFNLFGIILNDTNDKLYRYLLKLYNRQSHKDISDQYDF